MEICELNFDSGKYGKMQIGIMKYYDVNGNHGGEVGPSHEDFCATNKLIMVV